MRSAPKPPRPLNTRFCAIMQKAPLAEGCTFICKSLEGEDWSVNQYPVVEESEPEEDLDTDDEVDGPEGDLAITFLKRRKARRNAEKRKARAERAWNKTESEPKHQTKSKRYYDLDESEPEEDLDSLSEFEGPENDMRTIVLKAKRAEINARRRKARAERSSNKTEEKPKRQIKPKHEDDFENVQLIATSSSMISMFCDGVEHERWPEYFWRWREDQHWIS